MCIGIKPREYSTLNTTQWDTPTDQKQPTEWALQQKIIYFRSFPLSLPQRLLSYNFMHSVCVSVCVHSTKFAYFFESNHNFLFLFIFFFFFSLLVCFRLGFPTEGEKTNLYLNSISSSKYECVPHKNLLKFYYLLRNFPYSRINIKFVSKRMNAKGKEKDRGKEDKKREKKFACIKYSCNIWVLSTWGTWIDSFTHQHASIVRPRKKIHSIPSFPSLLEQTCC